MAPPGRVVWLASYPKSGNTWLRLLLANYLSASSTPVDINQINLDSPYPIRKHFLEESSCIDPSILTLEEARLLRAMVMDDFVRRCDKINFIKVHDKRELAPDGSPLLGRGDRWSAVYIVRDPRDVVVSMSFHENKTLDDTIAMLNAPQQTIGMSRNGRRKHVPQHIGDWSAHAASWVDQSDMAVHVLRYEDLLAEPVRVFRATLEFAGVETRMDQLECAVRNSDFTELQQQERRAGFTERTSQSIAPFFRSGRAGAWTEVLSTAQQAAITKAHRAMMERFGYL